MQYFEKNLIEAINEHKLACYCDSSYDRLMYWNRINWKDSDVLYNKSFLDNLTNYYYLGFPIKGLIQDNNSSGYCYSCILALSLCFENFTIVIGNLSSYASYLNSIEVSNDIYFEHAILILEDNKTVIDTSFGIITDYETYKKIFKINRTRIISSENVKNTDPYQFLVQERNNIGPSIDSQLFEDREYRDYINKIRFFLSLCDDYFNNKDLNYFYNSCISFNSNLRTIDYWRKNVSLKQKEESVIKKKNR